MFVVARTTSVMCKESVIFEGNIQIYHSDASCIHYIVLDRTGYGKLVSLCNLWYILCSQY